MNGIENTQADLPSIALISLFFFAGYFIFLRKSYLISPISRRKIYNHNNNNIENAADENFINKEEDLNFLLDN